MNGIPPKQLNQAVCLPKLAQMGGFGGNEQPPEFKGAFYADKEIHLSAGQK
jgi:hypothetical protein